MWMNSLDEQKVQTTTQTVTQFSSPVEEPKTSVLESVFQDIKSTDPKFIRYARSGMIHALTALLLINYGVVVLVQLWRHEAVELPSFPDGLFTLIEILFGVYVTGRTAVEWKKVPKVNN